MFYRFPNNDVRPETLHAVVARVNRGSLENALQTAIATYDDCAKNVEGNARLVQQFKDQSNELRGWIVALEFADVIAFKGD